MRKLAILAALCALAGVTLWTQRFEVKSFLSDRTWAGRAPHAGSGTQTSANGMRIEQYEVDSKLLDRALDQVAFLPPGATEGRPLLVFLHGRGGHPGGYRTQAAPVLAALGDRAPVIVQVSGGDHSYYHDRNEGEWGSYVVDEVIPDAIRRYDLDGSRVAIGGVSMGGFGAFDIARLHPGDFCAVGGHGAAMWTSAGQTPAGAFDDEADFERHDVIGAAQEDAGAYKGVRVWIDGGDDDPFRAANADLVAALRDEGVDVTTSSGPGGHSGRYWRKHFDEYVRFYATALDTCGDLGEGVRRVADG